MGLRSSKLNNKIVPSSINDPYKHVNMIAASLITKSKFKDKLLARAHCDELIIMTAISDNQSRLLGLLKAANYIICDGPSLSVVENTLLKNRSQLMRLPQIICAKNYLSIETVNQLKKEIGLIN